MKRKSEHEATNLIHLTDEETGDPNCVHESIDRRPDDPAVDGKSFAGRNMAFPVSQVFHLNGPDCNQMGQLKSRK